MRLAELRALVQEEGIGWLELRAVDLAGRLRSLELPAGALSERLLSAGVGVDASNYGLVPTEESDLVLLPDPTAAWVDRGRRPPALVMLCDLARPGEGLHPLAPRSVARRTQALLAELGIADEARFGVELEFYLFDSLLVSDSPLRQGVEVVPWEGAPGWGEPALPRPRTAYHAGGVEDRGRGVRQRACELLASWGIPVRYHHHEVGSLGQMEVELGLGPLLAAADWTVVAMDLIRRVAEEEGLVACFLPKPLPGQPGNGLHFHQLLLRGEENLFGGEEGLSELALHYVGGILKHGRALSALVSPSTNSYRRLRPEFEAPVHLAFGAANRTAAVRVPGYLAPGSARIEYRPPDPSCNPYLALSACLLAGLDGIRNEVDPVAKGWGPWDTSLYRLPPGKRRRIGALPSSLPEALDALERDHAFLTLGGAFPEELVELWLAAKRAEVAELAARPHPYEFLLYGP